MVKSVLYEGTIALGMGVDCVYNVFWVEIKPRLADLSVLR